MYKVLLTDPISQSGIDVFNQYNIDVINKPNITDDELSSILPDIDGWVIRSGTNINSNHIEDCKKLKVIGRAGVGIDNIDIHSATNNGIVVMNLPDGNTISAAEHTMALISALSRNIHLGHKSLIAGTWDRHKLVGNELRNKVLGVIGLGRIGREVIKRAQGYDMDILGYDPYVNEGMFNKDEINLVSIDEIISDSDIITIHVPLLDSTKNLFNMATFKKMKPASKIINVARGGIINEQDLAKALNDETISGAAIDVFENEPLDSMSPLISCKNILLTPHLGASTFEAKEGVSIGICQQVSEFLINGKLMNPINMPITDMSKLKLLTPYLDLARVMGKMHNQLCDGPIDNVSVECFGVMEETKPIVLSFLIGLLEDVVDIRLNFINIGNIAEERGVSYSHSYNSKHVSYTNLIKTHISFGTKSYTISGSIFGDSHQKIVEVMGSTIDLTPNGVMLFVQNKDLPGVIGKVGGVLGDANINIAEYILSRSNSSEALGVVKVDEKLSNELINKLTGINEILDVKQIDLNG